MGDDEQPDDDDVFLDLEGLGVLSRQAFQLHSFGMINSVRDGHPGFVSDDYLNAISAETSVAAVELETAGIWARREGGYFILKDDMLKVILSQNERMDVLAQECAEAGSHRLDPELGSDWVVCVHCGVPLQRPDRGPVALPRRGPLGVMTTQVVDTSRRGELIKGRTSGRSGCV